MDVLYNMFFCACEAGTLADRPNAVSILEYQIVKFSPNWYHAQVVPPPAEVDRLYIGSNDSAMAG